MADSANPKASFAAKRKLAVALALIFFSSLLAFFQPLRPVTGDPPGKSLWPGGEIPFDPWAFWYPLESNPYSRLPSINAILNKICVSADGAKLWAIGNHGLIIKSDDGGKSWRQLDKIVDANLFDLQFSADARNGLIVGPYSTLLASDDGGEHWHSLKLKNLESEAFFLVKVKMSADGKQAWISSGSGAALILLKLIFFNGAWQVDEEVDLSSLDLTQLSFFVSFDISKDGKEAWIQHDGRVFHTDGSKPTMLPTFNAVPKQLFFDISLNPISQELWLVGEKQMFHGPINGNDWHDIKIGQNYTHRLLAPTFTADGNLGWTIYWGIPLSKAIYLTTNGGKTWSKQETKSDGPVIDLTSSADGRHLWLLKNDTQTGISSILLHSSNQGVEWEYKTQPNSRSTNGADAPPPTPTRYPAPWFYLVLILAARMLFDLPNRRAEQLSLPKQDSDHPWRPGETDRLAIQPIAQALSRLLTYTDTQPPLTLGVTAGWGRGKSSLMNMLQEKLQLAAYHCVNFNAWHHQDETDVFISLLETVRGSLLPNPFTLRGLWLRAKIIYLRRGVSLLLLCFGLSGLLLSYLDFNSLPLSKYLQDPPLQQTQVELQNTRLHALQAADLLNYHRQLLGWRQQLVLSSASFSQLCPATVLPAVDKNASQPKPAVSPLKLFNPEECKNLITQFSVHAKTAADSATPATTATNQTAANASNANPTKQNPAATASQPPAAEAGPPVNPAPAAPAANAGQSTPGETPAIPGCRWRTDLGPCIFQDLDQLSNAIVTSFSYQLTAQQFAALSRSADALPTLTPAQSQAAGRWLLQIALCIVLIFISLSYTEITLLGENRLLKVLQPWFNKIGVNFAGLQHAGQLKLYEQRFVGLQQALQPRQLVIFIDDLDRCREEHAVKVLEVCNFLSNNANSCYFVLGFYPEYLKSCVGLHFAKIAAELIKEQATGANDERQHEIERELFAHNYLQKLINIEAPLPNPLPEHISELLKDQESTTLFKEYNSLLEILLKRPLVWKDARQKAQSLLQLYFQHIKNNVLQQWLLVLQLCNYLPAILLTLLLVLVSWSAYYQPERYPDALPLATQLPAKPASVEKPQATSQKNIQEPPQTLAKASTNTHVVIDGQTENADLNNALIVALTALLSLVALYLVILRQKQWLPATWQNLLQDVVGITEKLNDSKSFEQCLQCWQEVIAHQKPKAGENAGTLAPRQIKAFKNRARYFAVAAEQYYQAAKQTGKMAHFNECHWLAMAAIHYAEPRLRDFDLLYIPHADYVKSLFLNPNLVENHLNSIAKNLDDYENLVNLYQKIHTALTAQWDLNPAPNQTPAWPPSSTDRTLFNWLSENMKIH